MINECSRYVTEKSYCLMYETAEDHGSAPSNDDAEVEVILSYDTDCKIKFSLNENKVKGVVKSECRDVTCAFGIDSPKNVRIRQVSDDGWKIQKMQIQTYPGSLDFITYSLDGTNTQFWVDGDNNSPYGDGKNDPACTDGKWCNLMRVDPEGNPLHIILRQ